MDDRIATFTRDAEELLREQGEWRRGQTYFNLLRRIDPDAASEVVGTKYDPFFKDERVPAFVAWLTARWSA